MKILLGLLLMLPLAACSSGTTAAPNHAASHKPAGSASSPTAAALPPAARWRAARRLFNKTTSGEYDLTVSVAGLGTPPVRESGRYNLTAEALELERTIADVGDEIPGRDELVVRVQAGPAGRFMQMDDWGTWDGCWLEMSDETVAEQTGLDLSGIPDLPVAVVLIRTARVHGGQPIADGVLSVDVDAPDALSALGLGGRQLSFLAEGAASVRTPMTFTLTAGDRIAAAHLDGRDTLKALTGAGMNLEGNVRQFLAATSTDVQFRPSANAVEVSAPDRYHLLPEHATKKQTCLANVSD